MSPKVSGGVPPANDKDNAPMIAWKAKTRSQYENWYAMFTRHDPPMAFWFRYTLNACTDSEPEGRVWAVFFDGRDPSRNFRITQPVPFEQVKLQKTPAKITLGGYGSFENGRATGKLNTEGHEVVWDFTFTPNQVTYPSVGSALIAALVSSSRNISPNNDIKYSGTLEIDGQKLKIQNLPGHQGHTWGTKMQHAWAWAHCNAFDNDPSAVFEGVAVMRTKKGQVVGKAGSFYMKYKGETHFFNSVKHLKKLNQADFGVGKLKFTAEDATLKISGEITTEPEHSAYVAYEDVDHELLYNRNSCLASAKIDVFQRVGVKEQWKQATTLTAKRTADFEFVDRNHDGHEYKPKFS